MWHPDMPLEYRNAIVTGDARELAKAIPDESVDLIFTDPPYLREFIPLYGWLAQEAARILRPDGICAVMAGQSYLPDIYATMSRHLTYHWTFCLPTPTKNTMIFPRRVATIWKPILSFCKGTYKGGFWITDVMPAGSIDKRHHVWGQDVGSAFAFLSRVSGIVYDPFTGGGTVPAVCKMLGRNYIASEIDPDTAERARQRVLTTQEPLFVLSEEQTAMPLEALP